MWIPITYSMIYFKLEEIHGPNYAIKGLVAMLYCTLVALLETAKTFEFVKLFL